MSDNNGSRAALAQNSEPTDMANGGVKLHHEETDTIAEAAAVAADEADAGEPFPTHPEAMDEATALVGLTENVRDQDDLERDITYQANLVMIEKEDERDQKRIDKTKAIRDKQRTQKRNLQTRLQRLGNNPLMRSRLHKELDTINADIASLDQDIFEVQQRMEERHQVDADIETSEDQNAGKQRMRNETQRDFLIRTGKITPFSRMPVPGFEGTKGGLDEVLLDAEEDVEAGEQEEDTSAPRSHQNLRMPGFANAVSSGTSTPAEGEFGLRPRKMRRLGSGGGVTSTRVSDDETLSTPVSRKKSPGEVSEASFTSAITESDSANFGEEEDNGVLAAGGNRKRKSRSKAKPAEEKEDISGLDDGNEKNYQARLQDWVKRRSSARRQEQKKAQEESGEDSLDDVVADEEEWFKPHPNEPDREFKDGLKLPGDIYPALFDYQKTGVQWLGELHSNQVGGIIGDEMGLGKTIQIISFLAGLHYSKKITKPIIVVAPATVLKQWVNEFHRWWPPLRVSILHSSGSGMLNVRGEGRVEDDVDGDEVYGRQEKKSTKADKAAKKIVDRVVQHGHVLVTTYAGLQTYGDLLVPINWDYAVLDEGHKIRNPNTAITIYCKELRTPNRVILSGTPMQNNLIELWSLFDFVYPMRLGTLVNFRQQFEVPIKIGGYANATNLQIMTATKCAETLKEAISPYLLQRLKADVASDLPKKSEQVLFCKLTKPQREAYETFLESNEMNSILNRTRQSLYGIDILRKICNHPDLLDPRLRVKPGYKWGNPVKSGKMQVVKALLEMWKKLGHKTLLFSQGVQMLDIIEDSVKDFGGFNYLRMDGSTNIKDRQTMVDRFNNEPDLHVFLLTTKVGGLGVNLTGASRVIIFDPDWNPSTDVQARERAWRLGQKKEVTIYRLMTAGTIEEKIYHRQIFKQFLTNKILKDPKQRQTFHMKDLYDLFSLGSHDEETTETGQMFKGTEVRFKKAKNTGEPAPPLSDTIAQGGAKPVPAGEAQGDKDHEVRDMAGVAKLEAYRNSAEEEKNTTTEEDRLMSGIFARSGVHSALEHDEIINGKKRVTANHGMLEREAKRVAEEAARDLRKAAEVAKTVPIGTVTWTGEFGEAGRPRNLRRGGPNSTGILNGGHGLASSGPATPGSSRASSPSANAGARARGKDFLKLIRDYIIQQGGSVPSQMLVVHFNRMCKNARDTSHFKAMLDQVAVLKKGTGGRLRGRWELKNEHRQKK